MNETTATPTTDATGAAIGSRVQADVGFLTTWMTFIRDEQAMTTRMNVSYMPGVSEEYRHGRADGLRLAESTLGLLAYEHGIDLRDAGTSNAGLHRTSEAQHNEKG